ncbi:conserved protein of unknown function (plasmid) [Rhodovastum atsumiense]|uniref:hypothetical protein n=1 Tax=Rhodovastum atsumiense TaxID=504468 RepID=UPI0020257440|nr:hypothetical protein [Rhodovastum atsumiense]CAH2605610.1 conserved protein of unknown function [Rhodovastum atsumiense]
MSEVLRNDSPLPLPQAAARLTRALEQETALAHAGALRELAAAAEAKQAAFAVFLRSHDATSPDLAPVARAALRELMAAADENAIVLEAVKTTLEHTAGVLRTALSSAADPGIYGPNGQRPRHVLAARLDAQI